MALLYAKQSKSGSENSISCLRQGSEMRRFCLKQGRGLRASAAHLDPNFPWVPLSPPPPHPGLIRRRVLFKGGQGFDHLQYFILNTLNGCHSSQTYHCIILASL